VHEKYKMRGWWTQMVVVGYERIRGLRDRALAGLLGPAPTAAPQAALDLTSRR
jgi:hypothetical protein